MMFWSDEDNYEYQKYLRSLRKREPSNAGAVIVGIIVAALIFVFGAKLGGM